MNLPDSVIRHVLSTVALIFRCMAYVPERFPNNCNDRRLTEGQLLRSASVKRHHVSEASFCLDSFRRAKYVHMNMKAYFRRLWARLRHKFTDESEQLELNLWTRRSKR
jgi:hypothetical protein